MPFDDIARLVVAKLSKPEGGWVLSMDRTNWKYGRTHLNLLVVAIVLDKVAIPVLWKALPRATKCGNSRAIHRIDRMKRLLRILPRPRSRCSPWIGSSSGNRGCNGSKTGASDRSLGSRETPLWADSRHRSVGCEPPLPPPHTERHRVTMKMESSLMSIQNTTLRRSEERVPPRDSCAPCPPSEIH